MSFLLTTTAGKLQGLLDRVASIIRANHTVPILANVKLTSQETKLAMTASNLELEITAAEAIGPIDGSVSLTVNAKKLQTILSTIPENEELTLSQSKGDTVELKGTSGRFRFATLPSADFPTLDLIQANKPHIQASAKEEDLKALLDRVSFAMGISDVRYFLNAMWMKLDGSELLAVATNGHHLAKDAIKLTSPVGEPFEVLLPRATVLDLRRQLSKVPDPVTLEFDGKIMRATFSCVSYISKLIESKYPDYRTVSPPECVSAHINRSELRLAAQRALVLAGDGNRGVQLTVEPDMAGGLIRLEAKNQDEEAKVELVFDTPGVQPVETGFNVSYLVSALNAVEDTNVDLAISPKGGASMLTVPGLPDFTYLIMPMRV